MAKIVSMSSGAIDPIAQSKRVFWRPATPGTVLKVGQPVCYHSDSVLDHKDRTGDPTHLGLRQDTYAEGAQDKTARLFCVEEPLTANLNAFAGICKVLGPKAGADGDMIEIWIPNGSILPCWIDQNVTLDETILGIRNSEADVSYPGEDYTNPGRPIGVAKETINRGTPGLCWVKVDPNMFSFQYGITDAAYLKMDGGHPVNKQYVEMVDATPLIGFIQDNRLLYDATMTSGQLTVDNNYLHFTGTNTAAAASYLRGAVDMVHLDGCTINSGGLVIAGCCAQVGGTPSSFALCSVVCAMWVDVGLGLAPTTGHYCALRISNNGTAVLESLISLYPASCDFVFRVEEIPTDAHRSIIKMTGSHTFDNNDYVMKIEIGGNTYYIPCMDESGGG